MPNQKKGKATPKSTPSKAPTPKSPKTRGGVNKPTTPKKVETPKASPVARRESRSAASTPSKVESPKQPLKKVTPTKASPKTVGRPASTKVSPKRKPATPKSTTKGSPKARQQQESDSESEDDNTEFKVGDLIDAEWDDGLFYSAKVIKVNKTKSGNTYNVVFTQDNIEQKNLRRNQIQSYSEDSAEAESSPRKHKATNDDLEYVEEGQDVPLRYEDVSVESDSTESPRRKKAGRKPATKRKRVAEPPVHAPNAEKKRRFADSLQTLSDKQLLTLVKKVCNSNERILDAVQSQIPEPKPAPKQRAAPKKVAATQKTTPQKTTAKAAAPKKGGKAAKNAPVSTGRASRSSNK